MHFDDILAEIGQFGKYQMILLVWTATPSFFSAFNMLAAIFTGATPQYKCHHIWENSDLGLSNLTTDLLRNLSLNLDACSTFDIGNLQHSGHTVMDLETISRNLTKVTCAKWDYATDVFKSTIVTEWDLVCDKHSLNSVGSSIYMLGVLTGGVLSGVLADKYGRRIIILVCLPLQAVIGLITAYAPNFYVYVIMRYLMGTIILGAAINTFTLATEWIGPKYRMFPAIIKNSMFTFGYMAMAGIAYFIRDWRNLQIALSMQGILFISYIWLLPESARWLLANNRTTEAIELLKKAARRNGKSLPQTVLQNAAKEQADMGTKKPERNYSMLDLVRTPEMRKRSFVAFYMWFVNVLVYYGLSLGISDFGVNIYITQLIFGFVEIPANLTIAFCLPYSRRIPQMAFLAVGGVACLLTLVVPEGHPNVVTGLAVAGKFGISASFDMIYLYTAEIFPTVIRQRGMGASNMFSRIGGVMAPMINLFRLYSSVAPMIIFGCVSLIGSALCILLPETAGQSLPETIEDAENWSKRQIRNLKQQEDKVTPFYEDIEQNTDGTVHLEEKEAPVFDSSPVISTDIIKQTAL
ncbi:solute carrier family 22 member 13-like [Protopterus annectens]|uniref:solute carrier family 22 member 13-like n=1 Tax=Protopterus annectens TaxID=7888 RepID=UPI001CFB00D3|nr:solute carrier family 22 member 13-like [Protopterus annectens]